MAFLSSLATVVGNAEMQQRAVSVHTQSGPGPGAGRRGSGEIRAGLRRWRVFAKEANTSLVSAYQARPRTRGQGAQGQPRHGPDVSKPRESRGQAQV